LLYGKLEQGRQLVPPGHFHEVKYEELIRDPLGEMRRLYERLGLGEFEQVRPRIEAYLAANQGYQTNRYPSLTAETRAEIARRWGDIIRRHGYSDLTPP